VNRFIETNFYSTINRFGVNRRVQEAKEEELKLEEDIKSLEEQQRDVKVCMKIVEVSKGGLV
jgi:hypothetical protein